MLAKRRDLLDGTEQIKSFALNRTYKILSRANAAFGKKTADRRK